MYNNIMYKEEWILNPSYGGQHSQAQHRNFALYLYLREETTGASRKCVSKFV